MSQDRIPQEMNAVVLDSFSGASALRVEKRPVPRPGPNEVLIKIAASPINPSDLAFLDGLYSSPKQTPVVPGFEGSGTVVAAGGGLMGKFLMGKQVACVSSDNGDGVWAEYMVTPVKYALPLHASVSLEQGAMSIVNPLMAVAMLEVTKKAKHTHIVQSAGASTLGKMINRLFSHNNVAVINIVRSDEQVEILKELGATIILNSSDENFDEQLGKTCRQQGVRLGFDAVSGPTTGQMLTAMLPGAKVYVYGGLSEEPCQVDPGGLIFQKKSVEGMWLTDWLNEKSLLKSMSVWKQAQKLMLTDLVSTVRKQYSLLEVEKAVQEYQDHMTGGKVLLKP